MMNALENVAAVIALLLTLEIVRLIIADLIRDELEHHRAVIAATVLFFSNGYGRTRYQRILPLKRRTAAYHGSPNPLAQWFWLASMKVR